LADTLLRVVGFRNNDVRNFKDMRGMQGNAKSLKMNERARKGIPIAPSPFVSPVELSSIAQLRQRRFRAQVRLVSSLWSLKTPWPMAAWWTGGTSWFRKKWLLKSDTATLEQLARSCVCEQREVTQIWAARGTRTFAIKIRMAPTYSRSYAMAVLSPCRPARQVPPKAIRETTRQLNLFDGP